MPFTIKKNKKGKHCVFKKEGEEAVGESLGCHTSQKEAIAQIGAIESKEKEQGKSVNYVISWDDIEFVPATITTTTGTTSETYEYYISDNTVWYDQKGNLLTEKRQFREEVGGGVDVDKLKDSDFVLSKERKFPIVIPKDVKDAVASFGRAKTKTSFEEFKKLLIALARRKGKSFVAALPEKWKEEMEKSFKAHDSKEEAAAAAEELGCEGSHKMPDGSYMPCSTHEEFIELSGKKSIEITDVENLQAYVQDEDGHWVLELDSELIKSFINPEENESEIDTRYAIKSLGQNRIGAYGVLWGDEEKLDLHGEFFTQETTDIKAVFDAMGVVPFIVHHAGDDEVKSFVIGPVDVMEADDIGLWYEAKIKEFEAYRRYVEPLLKENKLFSSSGTLPAAKRVNKDTGEITRWPIVEMTGTWLPAEWRMMMRPISEIKSAYQELGHEIDLSEYEEQSDEVKDEKDAKGVEKTRLMLLIEQELRDLGLFEIEL